MTKHFHNKGAVNTITGRTEKCLEKLFEALEVCSYLKNNRPVEKSGDQFKELILIKRFCTIVIFSRLIRSHLYVRRQGALCSVYMWIIEDVAIKLKRTESFDATANITSSIYWKLFRTLEVCQ